MIWEDEWIDAGHCADWWGGVKDAPTCHQRAVAKETRIDGILANMWALPMIRDFKVTKNEDVPTHAVIELTLEEKEDIEARSFVKTLPSLKKLLTAKWKRGQRKKTPRNLWP